MKNCGYCGKEYPDETTHCPLDGTPLSAPGERQASNRENSPLPIEGSFRLTELGNGFSTRKMVLASDMGGLKEGLLTVDGNNVVLVQKMRFLRGLSLPLVLFVAVAAITHFLRYLLSAFIPEAGPITHTTLFLLQTLLAIRLSTLITRRVGLFECRFSLADLSRVELHTSGLAMDFQTGTKPSDPTAVKSAGDMELETKSGHRLVFKPHSHRQKSALLATLADSGVVVKDVIQEEEAIFKRMLSTATPRVWVAYVLVALNVVIFAIMASTRESSSLQGNAGMIARGADYAPLTVTAHHWWRLLTCCFLHFGLLHLACNMFALLLVGKLIEQLFGSTFFLVIYVACGLISSLTFLWFYPTLVSVGASGAVSGIYGALLGYLARQGGSLPRNSVIRIITGASPLIVWNAVYLIQDVLRQASDDAFGKTHEVSIDHATQVAGFLSGLIFGFLAARPLNLDLRRFAAQNRWLALSSAICLIATLLLVPLVSANLGNVENFKLLGRLHQHGEGVPRNAQAAVNWFTRAANQGDVSSHALLGALYFRGEGVEKDVPKALEWFGKAGEMGDLGALKFVGRAYLNGQGIKTNIAEGFQWFTQAASKGDVEAQRMLAGAYFSGEGMGRNTSEAAKWAIKAAEQGDAKSQYMIATMCYMGDGVAKDQAKAAVWYRQAANQGDTNAQTMLGLLFSQGEGVERNQMEALKWLTLGGDKKPEIENERKRLGQQLTPEQKAQLKNDVQKFQSRHPFSNPVSR